VARGEAVGAVVKFAWCILARDKAAHVGRAMRSAFEQTLEGLEIVISDQGSTDGTREAIAREVEAYRGPHAVRVLDCPDTAPRGMAGLNAHFAWVATQIDAEAMMPASADDCALPECAAEMLRLLETSGAAMVGMPMLTAGPDGAVHGRAAFSEEGFVSVRQVIEHKIGGSAQMAWRRDFFERIGPVPAICGADVFLPPLACVLGGFFVSQKPLYIYVQHRDAGNMGLEGVLAAAPEAERLPIVELMHWQTGRAYEQCLLRMVKLGAGTPDERDALAFAAFGRYRQAAKCREEMTLAGQAVRQLQVREAA
jgi:hypothetical protein